MTNEVHGLAGTTGSRGTGFPLGNGEGAMDSEIGHSGAAERDGHWGAAGGLPVQERPRAGAVVGRPSSAGASNSRNLVAIHDHLRGELRQIRRAVEEIAAGEVRGARTASWRSAG